MRPRQIRAETLGKSLDATTLCRTPVSADRKVEANLPPMCGQIEESAPVLPVPLAGRASALRAPVRCARDMGVEDRGVPDNLDTLHHQPFRKTFPAAHSQNHRQSPARPAEM
jgi:hypothetical protein